MSRKPPIASTSSPINSNAINTLRNFFIFLHRVFSRANLGLAHRQPPSKKDSLFSSRRISLTRLHKHQLPDMAIKILKAVPVHESMVLRLSRSPSSGSD